MYQFLSLLVSNRVLYKFWCARHTRHRTRFRLWWKQVHCRFPERIGDDRQLCLRKPWSENVWWRFYSACQHWKLFVKVKTSVSSRVTIRTKMLRSFQWPLRPALLLTRTCPLSWLWVICFHGNGLLFILASSIPIRCTVWRMRKVFNHSPKKVQAISPIPFRGGVDDFLTRKCFSSDLHYWQLRIMLSWRFETMCAPAKQRNYDGK